MLKTIAKCTVDVDYCLHRGNLQLLWRKVQL